MLLSSAAGEASPRPASTTVPSLLVPTLLRRLRASLFVTHESVQSAAKARKAQYAKQKARAAPGGAPSFFSLDAQNPKFKILFLPLFQTGARNTTPTNQSCRSPPRPSVSFDKERERERGDGGKREKEREKRDASQKRRSIVLAAAIVGPDEKTNALLFLLLLTPPPLLQFPPHATHDRFPPYRAQPRDEEGSREVRGPSISILFGREEVGSVRHGEKFAAQIFSLGR